MTRRNQITTSVKVLINTSLLSQKDKQRLRQILGRDSRIISRYIGIIEDNRNELVDYKEKKNGKISIKIDKGKLDQLTCTTSDRKIVNHDLKIQFLRISLNELKECRDTAVGMYLSFLELEVKSNASIPTVKSSVPRSIGYRRFKLHYQERTLTIMDSMDTNLSMINNGKKKIQHDKLPLNLDLKKYHFSKIMEGSLQAVRIIRSRRNYYAIFAIRHDVKQLTSKFYPKKSRKDLAIAGIDLGINRDAVISVITAHGVSCHKFIKLERIENTKLSILKLDRRIAEIQQKAAKRLTDNEQTDGLYSLLRELRSERSELKYEISHQLSAEINKYLLSLTNQYDLWIGIGKLKGIRRGQRRGNGNKRHRKRMHRWAYGQLTWMLEYKLSKSGYKRRFLTIPEGWTSIKCWKCNDKGKRPKQEFFKCKNRSCKWMGDADFNGATNIAKRAAKYFKLTSHLKSSLFEVRELGFAKPKTMKVLNKNNTRGRSNLSNNLSDSNAVVSDQAVDKNHGRPSLLISFFEPSKEGEDDRSTDLLNQAIDKSKSRALLTLQKVVATPDSVCGT